MTIRHLRTPWGTHLPKVLGCALAGCVLVAGLAGCGTSSHAAALSPGQQREQLASKPLPSYLPSGSTGNELVDGSAAKPAVSLQGVAVRADLKNSSTVLVNVVGPDVDRSTGDPDAASVDCTFTMSFQKASAPVAFAMDRVTATDDAGGIHQLQLSPGQPTPPGVIAPGQQVSVKVHAWLPPGEGLIRWAPDDDHVIAVWDYIAEID